MRQRVATVLAALALAGACAPVPVPRTGPYHTADAAISITRLVHASALVEVDGVRFYLDPWLYSGVLRRQTEPLGLRPHALPAADALLLTSDAPDRLDRRALAQIAPRTPLAIVPPSLVGALHDLGFHEVRALDPWDETQVGTVTVTAVPAARPGRTTGWVLASPRGRVYAAGPTRLGDTVADVAAAFPDLDVALLPIGGRRVLGVRREMGPEEAAEATRRLRPRRVVPIAYGRTGGEPFVWHARRPVERFRDALGDGPGTTVLVLPPGESWHAWGTGEAP